MNIAEEIKSRVDIIDFISDTVNLRKAGKNYTGFCPFHQNTKTPSFIVFPDTQTWRCFGACADGGDIFSFVMKREGCDFKEALQLLARRAGVSLQEVEPQAAEKDQQRQKLVELLSAAAAYFHHLLTASPAGAYARDYLARREISLETITTFQLGYALDEWDALKNHFTGRGYSLDFLLAAGLIVERDDGSPGYDRFRNRLVIPIRDTQGRVIGFGARALADQQLPKYLNSPQTALFDKSATLYGLDLARKHIRAADRVVIVEGYMDVIQAHQRGAKNVVAQMGTALTEQQLKILKRTTRNFVLALDADIAGQAATLRGLNIAREALERETVPVVTARGLIRYENRLNADIRIAALPKGKDPDDILREGLEAWQKILETAVPVIDFYFQAVTANLNLNSAKGKSVAVQELIPVLRDIGNTVEQEHYVQKLARLIHVDERTLMAELKRNTKTRSTPRRQPESVSSPPAPKNDPGLPKINTVAEVGLEEYCLSLILAYPSTLAVANDMLEQQEIAGLVVNDFKRGENKEIFKSLQLWTVSEAPDIELLKEMVDEVLGNRLNTLVSLWPHQVPAPAEKVSRDLCKTILKLKLRNIIEQIKELDFLQREAIENRDPKAIRQYTELVEMWRQQRKKLEQSSDALTLVGKRRAEVNM
jgi:DNA primase